MKKMILSTLIGILVYQGILRTIEVIDTVNQLNAIFK